MSTNSRPDNTRFWDICFKMRRTPVLIPAFSKLLSYGCVSNIYGWILYFAVLQNRRVEPNKLSLRFAYNGDKGFTFVSLHRHKNSNHMVIVKRFLFWVINVVYKNKSLLIHIPRLGIWPNKQAVCYSHTLRRTPVL